MRERTEATPSQHLRVISIGDAKSTGALGYQGPRRWLEQHLRGEQQ